jgi:hypothetical protein
MLKKNNNTTFIAKADIVETSIATHQAQEASDDLVEVVLM